MQTLHQRPMSELDPRERERIIRQEQRRRATRRPIRREMLETLHAQIPLCHHCGKSVRLAPENARVDATCAVLNFEGRFITCGYCVGGPSPVAMQPGSLAEIALSRARDRAFRLNGFLPDRR